MSCNLGALTYQLWQYKMKLIVTLLKSSLVQIRRLQECGASDFFWLDFCFHRHLLLCQVRQSKIILLSFGKNLWFGLKYSWKKDISAHWEITLHSKVNSFTLKISGVLLKIGVSTILHSTLFAGWKALLDTVTEPVCDNGCCHANMLMIVGIVLPMYNNTLCEKSRLFGGYLFVEQSCSNASHRAVTSIEKFAILPPPLSTSSSQVLESL